MQVSIRAAAVGGLMCLLASASSAATLISAVGDRTVVRDGDIQLTFLDLTETKGVKPSNIGTVAAAEGFALATFDQVAALLSAFGITLPAEPNKSFTVFAATDDQVRAVGDAIGYTSPVNNFGNFAVSGLFDGRFAYGTQVRLANATAPGAGNFISNQNDRDGNTLIGLFLVQETPFVDAVPVPLPATGLMLIAGLGGLGLMRRRSKLAKRA